MSDFEDDGLDPTLAWMDGPEEDDDDDDDDDDAYQPSDDDDSVDPLQSNAHAAVERQMAEDFNRLTRQLQDSSNVEGPHWEFDFGEGADLDLEQDADLVMPERRKRPRGVLQLSPQLKDLVGKVNNAFVQKDYETAIPICREIIRIEPQHAPTWMVYASCLEELGYEDQALQCEIIGAHLEAEAEKWKGLGDKCRLKGLLEQSCYCFGKVVLLDPLDIDARWDHSYLLRQLGHVRRAAAGFRKILQVQKGHPNVLEELRQIYVDLDDLPQATRLYQETFEYFKALYPNGDECSFKLPQLSALADFYISTRRYDRAILTIRSGARWFDGRLAESAGWDPVADDREFDLDDYVRADKTEGPQGFFPLDLNLRQRLFESRLKLGELEEAKMHAEIVLQDDMAVEYGPLFARSADVYFELEMYEPARGIYETLASNDETSTSYIALQLGACYRYLSNYDNAIEVFKWAIACFPDQPQFKTRLAEIYEITGQLRMALELVEEVIAAKETAADQTPQQDRPVISGSLFDETRKRGRQSGSRVEKLTKSQKRDIEARRQDAVETAFRQLDKTEQSMLQGEERAIQIWLQEGGTIIEDYRVTKQLFMSDRFAKFRGIVIERRQTRRRKNAVSQEDDDEEEMATQLHREMVEDAVETKVEQGLTHFRGVSFDRWLLLFVQYSFLLTRQGQYGLADEILRHTLLSNPFSDISHQNTIQLALMTCAIRAGDHPKIIEHQRKLMFVHQFNNEPLRMILATLGSGLYATEAVIDPKLMKYFLRELRLFEQCAPGSGTSFVWKSSAHRWRAVGEKDLDDEENEDETDDDRDGSPSGAFRATQASPIIYAFYGQMCLCAKSYQSAIWYLSLAYELQPLDPLICLSLAVACLGRAMQRQVDNRSHMIVQATAFLAKYRTFRRAEGLDLEDEIQFNFGRAFQQLGLHSLAVKHLEACLAIVSERQKTDPEYVGVAREAAYNLSIVYVTSGATGLARSLYKTWLSV